MSACPGFLNPVDSVNLIKPAYYNVLSPSFATFLPPSHASILLRSGLVAAGGVHAELFLAPLSAIPSSSSHPPQHDNQNSWTSTVRLNGSINNALFLTNLALASSPYHLPSKYDAVGSRPRLFVSNNDCSMRVYNVATHPSVPMEETDAETTKRKRPHRLSKAGVLQAKTCVNHGQLTPSPLSFLNQLLRIH